MILRTFKNRTLTFLTLVSFALSIVHPSLVAQSKVQSQKLGVMIVNMGSTGLTQDASLTLFANLQSKLAQFDNLDVKQRPQVLNALNERDRSTFQDCAQLDCMRSMSGKVGIDRIVACVLTRNNTSYRFQSFEFDVRTGARLSQTDQSAVCKTAQAVDEFTTKIAIVVGQRLTGVTTIPKGLQTSGSGWLWYVGGAAVAGIAAGVYFIVSKSAAPSSGTKGLPGPPDFPTN
jgi:hypothetical protein